MIYIIYPHDESTKFLLEIYNQIPIEKISFIEVHASDNSYNEAKEMIKAIPENALILFMGHGQENRFYGAEDDDFEKKPLITSNDMKFFSNKFLVALACNSNEFLKSTNKISNIKSSIGFGSLPTEMREIKDNKKLSTQGIDQKTIDLFKISIVKIISLSLKKKIEDNLTFEDMYYYLRLLLNKQINQAILGDKKDRKLGDLLFQMKYDIVYY